MLIASNNFTATKTDCVAGLTNTFLKIIHLRNNTYYRATYFINSVSYQLTGKIVFTTSKLTGS